MEPHLKAVISMYLSIEIFAIVWITIRAITLKPDKQFTQTKFNKIFCQQYSGSVPNFPAFLLIVTNVIAILVFTTRIIFSLL
jgi:hypothetical protein